jgi:parvulin-like peptidyl-prolyl isomerase
MSTRRLTMTLLTFACLGALAAGCGGGGKKSSTSAALHVSSSLPTGVVAVVSRHQITKQQLDDLLAQTRLRDKLSHTSFPTPGTSAYRQLQDRAVLYLVQREELTLKAQALGINVEKQVDAGMKQLKKQSFGGSEKRYQQALKKQGFTDAQVRDDLRSRLQSQEIKNRVTAHITVTDEEVRTYYIQHLPLYTTPQTRLVRHILVKSKSLANELYKKLKTGASFGALAKKYSIDKGSKDNGGRYTDTRGTFVKPFEDVAFTLRTGQISKPVHSQYGWHIIQALKPATGRKTIPFAKVKSSIRTTLLQQRQQQAISAWSSQFTKDVEKNATYAKGFEPTTATTSG